MTQNLSPAQQAQLDNRDSSGQWQQKTHADVDDPAGVLGVENSEASTDAVTRGLDGERGGFEADLSGALGETPGTVTEDPEGRTVYALGDGEVTITQVPSQGFDLPDGRRHETGARFVVEDHAGDQPRPVISSSDDPRLNPSTAQRAVEHMRALDAGQDPLNESLDENHHPPHDGLPASYGLDLSETGEDTQALARKLQSDFGSSEDENEDVVAYDSGGGMEVIKVSESDPDSIYEVRVSSTGGGSLDAPGWSVTASYLGRDGEWVEDDGELALDPIEIEDDSATGKVSQAVQERMGEARAKFADSIGQ